MIQTLPCGAYGANSYLLTKPERADALLIDAGDDARGLLDAVRQSGKALAAIVLTHGHFDHILAAKALRDATGAKIYIHALDAEMLRDERLNLLNPRICRQPFEPCEADERIATPGGEGALSLCGFSFRVLHTPGHTPGGISLYSAEDGAVFTGDTLFSGGYGRTDFPGGSYAEIAASILRLRALPGDTAVYPGHGEASVIAEAGGGMI